jgi:hypothetical protein
LVCKERVPELKGLLVVKTASEKTATFRRVRTFIRGTNLPTPIDTQINESTSLDFETSAYDILVKEFLQDRFPGVDYPSADITVKDGIEKHNIIMC